MYCMEIKVLIDWLIGWLIDWLIDWSSDESKLKLMFYFIINKHSSNQTNNDIMKGGQNSSHFKDFDVLV